MKIFLDDERFPPNNETDWVICRNVVDAIEAILTHGYPNFVSFDNDLGEDQPEGRLFAQWLIDYDIDENAMPDDFDFYVHSQNPVARDAINALLNNYLRHKGAK